MAGESATEVARRQREKAERLVRQAEKYERGAEGEARTADVLATLPDGWVVRNDVAWPGRPRANIDHVVIGSAGVFVIDSKNWSGRVTISQGVLRCSGYAKTREVEKASAANDSIAALVPRLGAGLFTPVLCFVQDESVDGRVDDVEVTTTEGLVTTLCSHQHLLSINQVSELVAELDARLDAATGPRKAVVVEPATTQIEPARRRKGLSLGARLGLSAAMFAVLVGVPLVAAAVLRIGA